MKETKIGVPAGYLGAACFLLTYFGGYVAAILLAGYILLFEENQWLKNTAVKSLVMGFMFSILTAVVGLFPDALSWMATLFSIFDGKFNYSVVSNIFSLITKGIVIVKTIVFLLASYKAVNQESVSIPTVDKIVNKCMH